MRLEDRHDAGDLGLAERRNVLAEIDGEVGGTVGLIRGDPRPRHLAQHLGADRLQPAPAVGALGIGLHIAAAQFAAGFGVMPHPEGPVLAHHGIDRPEAGDVVAPAGRPAGHGDHQKSGLLEGLQRAIGIGGETALGRHGFIDVGQHAFDGGQGRTGAVRERGHHGGTLLNMASRALRG